MGKDKKYILDKGIADKKMRRMALEIIENNAAEDELILIGIEENGVVVAQHLGAYIETNSAIKIKQLTVSLDKRKPAAIQLSATCEFTDKVVILIDDVANSGKTLLYALKPLLEQHPKRIQTAVLVGRSHSSFPIHMDYVGIAIATTLQDHIFVEVDKSEITGAYLA